MKINQVDAQGGLRRGGEGANGLKKNSQHFGNGVDLLGHCWQRANHLKLLSTFQILPKSPPSIHISKQTSNHLENINNLQNNQLLFRIQKINKM